jgi:hypothetical protein
MEGTDSSHETNQKSRALRAGREDKTVGRDITESGGLKSYL